MKKKVLVIDDDEPILTMTKGMLEEDYDVTTVESGHAALDLFSIGYAPDLVLLDLYMPEMGGLNTLIKIQKYCNSNKTRVVIYSSSEDPDSVTKAKEFGADDYIHKPVSRFKLLEKVAALVN